MFLIWSSALASRFALLKRTETSSQSFLLPHWLKYHLPNTVSNSCFENVTLVYFIFFFRQQNKNYLQSFWGATFLASGWSAKLRFFKFFCQEIQELLTPFSVNCNFPVYFSPPFLFFFLSNFRELIFWIKERISRTLSTWLVQLKRC